MADIGKASPGPTLNDRVSVCFVRVQLGLVARGEVLPLPACCSPFMPPTPHPYSASSLLPPKGVAGVGMWCTLGSSLGFITVI